jgi:ketosteroid isomerase-like protein
MIPSTKTVNHLTNFSLVASIGAIGFFVGRIPVVIPPTPVKPKPAPQQDVPVNFMFPPRIAPPLRTSAIPRGLASASTTVTDGRLTYPQQMAANTVERHRVPGPRPAYNHWVNGWVHETAFPRKHPNNTQHDGKPRHFPRIYPTPGNRGSWHRPPQLSVIKQAIKKKYTKMDKAFSFLDPDTALSMCTADFTLNIINGLTIRRNANFSALYKRHMARVKRVMEVENEDMQFLINGNHVTVDRDEVMDCLVTDSGDDHKVEMRNHFQDTWQRVGGEWKLQHSELLNDSREWWDGQELDVQAAMVKVVRRLKRGYDLKRDVG